MTWPTASLAEVSKVFGDGDWIESKDQSSDGIRLVQTGNVGEGFFKDRRDKVRFISEETFDRLNCTEVLPNDILISRLPDPVGRSCIIPETGDRMITAVDCTIVRPDPQRLNPSFLVYYSQSSDYKSNVEDRCTGTTRKRISRKNLGQLHVPLPPMEEQKRIVVVLDQAFAALDCARANAEANLADAEELFENTLENVFDALASNSDTRKLADAVHPDCKLSYGIVQPGDQVDDGLPIVRPVDLKSRRITKHGLKRIAPSKAQGYARTTLTGFELLLCVRGSTGEVSMTTAKLDGANVTRGIVPIRFEPEKVDLDFAYFQMRSPFARKQVAEKTYGAALMQINIKDLRALDFVLPSIEVQRQTTSKVEKLSSQADALRAKYQADLGDIEDLRQSILQKAFAGELT